MLPPSRSAPGRGPNKNQPCVLQRALVSCCMSLATMYDRITRPSRRALVRAVERRESRAHRSPRHRGGVVRRHCGAAGAAGQVPVFAAVGCRRAPVPRQGSAGTPRTEGRRTGDCRPVGRKVPGGMSYHRAPCISGASLRRHPATGVRDHLRACVLIRKSAD